MSGCYWDPWWGYVCGTGTADLVVADQDDWDFGFNFGAGVSLRLQNGPVLFLEGIYNTVNFAVGRREPGHQLGDVDDVDAYCVWDTVLVCAAASCK